jgi:hypothetical protein
MLRSGGHVCGAAADSLIGVYSGDAPPQQLINFILRIPTKAVKNSDILTVKGCGFCICCALAIDPSHEIIASNNAV